MAVARVVSELFVKMPTRVGLLADVAEAIAAEHVGVLAIGAYDKEGAGEFYLITTENETAREVLASLGGEILENDVVLVELADRPGSLAKASRRLAAAGINVDWVYATTAPAPTATAIFRVPDPAAAVDALNAPEV